MLEQLRIQCPSCGIILDVRNSKHETLKQIVCPNCKKQLAVNFEEELEPLAPPQPIEPLYYGEMRIDLKEGVNKIALPDCDNAEIKVIRLKDGYCKCMVRPLSKTIPVKVNGQLLQADEQVVLSKGDYLEIDKTCLRAGEPGTLTPSSREKNDDSEETKDPKPRHKKERNFIWLYAALAFVALMGATIYLWPTEQVRNNPQAGKLVAQDYDTTVNKPSNKLTKDALDKPKDTLKRVDKPIGVPPKSPKEKTEDISPYDLERLANQGDTDAQYKLGVDLIKKGGVNNVVRGINYLKAAANNGFSKARTALSKAISSLQKQANQGDSISYYILKSI